MRCKSADGGSELTRRRLTRRSWLLAARSARCPSSQTRGSERCALPMRAQLASRLALPLCSWRQEMDVSTDGGGGCYWERDAPCVLWTTAVAGCLERRLVNQHDPLWSREAAG